MVSEMSSLGFEPYPDHYLDLCHGKTEFIPSTNGLPPANWVRVNKLLILFLCIFDPLLLC